MLAVCKDVIGFQMILCTETLTTPILNCHVTESQGLKIYSFHL